MADAGVLNAPITNAATAPSPRTETLEGWLQALTQPSALTELAAKVDTLVVTRGADGATAIANGERISIPAAPVAQVVDTTGAGDLFAAGFLAARAKGASLERCLWTGAIAAGEVIKHYGARPIVDLKKLVQL